MKIKIASMDITRKCTMRCLHCYNRSGDERCEMEELSDSELIDILTETLQYEPEIMCLCGGEPLLRWKAVKEFILKTRAKGETVQINTVSNGELLTEEIAEELMKAGLNCMQISLDGGSPETHDWLRNKKGAFEKAVRALKILGETRRRLEIPFQIAVSFCPNKKNISELTKAMEICQSLGVDRFRVQPLMVMGRANDNLSEYVLSSKEYKNLAKTILASQDRNILENTSMEAEWVDPIDHLLMEKSEIACSIQINASGELMLSPYIPIVVGNLRKKSLESYMEADYSGLWEHPLFAYLRECMITPEKLNLCNEGLPSVGISEVCFDAAEDDCKDKMTEYLCQIRRRNV